MKNERGVAAVEMALMLPFLILLMVVIIDLGLILREHQILNNAAREGARFSSLPKNWVDVRNPSASMTTIQNRVIEYCAQENQTVTASDITIDQSYPITVGSRTLLASRVTVQTNRPLMVLDFFVGTPTIPLTGEAVFTNLY